MACGESRYDVVCRVKESLKTSASGGRSVEGFVAGSVEDFVG